MSTIGMVLTVILMILAVILAAIILMQSKRSAGLGAVSGNSSDTYWSKNQREFCGRRTGKIYKNRRRTVHDSCAHH